MPTVAKVAAAMQTVLTHTAESAACLTQFIKRQRQFTGASFVQTLVFGWMAQPAASLDQLCQTAAARGVVITPQGLAQRFTPAAAACLRMVLEATLTEVLAADPVAVPLLERFTAVYVHDSTTIALPDALQEHWQGCGGRTTSGTQAAVKAHVRLDLRHGTLAGPILHPGRASDQQGAPQATDLPAEALLVTDLGFFCLDRLTAYTAAGIGWLLRLKVSTRLRVGAGPPTDLGTLLAAQPTPTVDLPVEVGAQHHLACRLVAVRVPEAAAAARRRTLHQEAGRKGRPVSQARLAVADWTFYITNVSVARLTLRDILVLAGARWQIELVFRRWKSLGQVDVWRSAQPWRILCEVYAKLIGVVVQHWLVLTGAWVRANRSLWKAMQAVQAQALHLASVFDHPARLTAALTTLAFTLTTGCRLNTRRTHPNTCQLLLQSGGA